MYELYKNNEALESIFLSAAKGAIKFHENSRVTSSTLIDKSIIQLYTYN